MVRQARMNFRGEGMRSPSDMVVVGDWYVPPVIVFEYSSAEPDAEWPDMAVTVRVEGGNAYLHEVRITARNARSQLVDDDLRGLAQRPAGELVQWIVANGPKHRRENDGSVGPPVVQQTSWEYGDLRRAVREGRVRADLNEVAEVYRRGGRRGTRAVKEYLEKLRGKTVSERTAQLEVQKARQAGLLGPALPGKAGEQRKGERQ